ncbi:MAG: bifunctional phosphoribosyl-AMP cyclohydrolase/phosphoribosyl-ATP diphosphatase HisIE [Bacteroidales bacterium]|jgi:phosphoribosyl-ATP pyrophosphohydrolase/phosphoribosyl-AMP cyclohydrolase|nr:bifunctional phosphoribosyl-AMP cyclohydrolase/phosphoribosyl-ATP diphosphatase HisIE [Bacteroidales bacterium]
MTLHFSKSQDGLLPAIVQDAHTQKVLMLGFMNEEAFEKTKATKKVTFYSRTRQTLWTKGETSGNFLHVVSIAEDCDHDTLLIKVRPEGPTCHTGSDTCFEEKNSTASDFLQQLENVILARKLNPVEGSYTNRLFSKGVNKIAQKVGEEAVELVIEAKDNNEELFLGEAADLMYHYLVLLVHKGYSLNDVIAVLEKRHK